MIPENFDRQVAEDQRFMRDALALGWRQQGLTSPNPAVGAVIVCHDGVMPVIVGHGATQKGGRPHGEAMAIAMAGEAAIGSTLYVTLEPCSHHGRAQPCANAIIEAGIARVVSAIEDPDPRVAGQGHARLLAAGIAVNIGIGANQALRAHKGHILRVTKGRPMVTLKIAQTRDGFASHNGDGRLLITGETANNQVHLMRMHADAIVVGLGTVVADNPMLTVRLPGLSERSPIRVILDSQLRTPMDSHLVITARDWPTWIICTQAAAFERANQYESQGVDIICVDVKKDGRISLQAALQALSQRGIARLFAEGGPMVAEALAHDDLIDEAVIISGPLNLKQISASDGTWAMGPRLTAALADSAKFTCIEYGQWGDDKFENFERHI